MTPAASTSARIAGRIEEHLDAHERRSPGPRSWAPRLRSSGSGRTKASRSTSCFAPSKKRPSAINAATPVIRCASSIATPTCGVCTKDGGARSASRPRPIAPPTDVDVEPARRQPSLTKSYPRPRHRSAERDVGAARFFPEDFRDRVTQLIGDVSGASRSGRRRRAVRSARRSRARCRRSIGRVAVRGAGRGRRGRPGATGARRRGPNWPRIDRGSADEPWQRALEATVDRSLRTRFGLPIIVIDDAAS